MAEAAEWVRVEHRFGSLFSYRIPDFNSFYALASPLPSPSAFKLALVASAIEGTASVDAGKAMLDIVREAPVLMAPPETVGGSRVLVKRMKKGRTVDGRYQGLTVSFGIREYLHLGGPLSIWISVPSDAVEQVLAAARFIRRLGTTDSLCTVDARAGANPDPALCARRLDDCRANIDALRGRLSVPLNDLGEKAQLEHFAPNGGKNVAAGVLIKQMYVFPLTIAQQGANWMLWRRMPFE